MPTSLRLLKTSALCWFDCALNLRVRCPTPKKSSPIRCQGSGSENPSSRVMQRSVSNAASIYLLPPSSRMPTTSPRPGSSLPRLASPSRRASQSLTSSLRNSPWLPEGIKISESPFGETRTSVSAQQIAAHGDYAVDQVRAIAQWVELVSRKEVRIRGLRSELLRTPIAAAGVEA